jgi:RNA polymerase sigma-70 factor (family 1)
MIKFGLSNSAKLIKSYSNYTEPELITLWQNGDEKVFDFLYKKYVVYLINIAAKKVGSTETAKELVQDVFLNIYMKRDSIKTASGFAPYLLRSLRNRIYDYYRKRLSEEKYEKSLRPDMYIVTDDTQEELEAKELNEQIYQKLQQLPERRREIFLLRQEGISNKEIAERLNLSVNTVENQIHKALRFLKSAVNNLFLFFL